jgi:hypothetical protein
MRKPQSHDGFGKSYMTHLRDQLSCKSKRAQLWHCLMQEIDFDQILSNQQGLKPAYISKRRFMQI